MEIGNGLSFEQLDKGVLVTDSKVSDKCREINCYRIKGWDLTNDSHAETLRQFVEACCQRGFIWALQKGHPKPENRGREATPLEWVALSRAYSPQPTWDVVVENPGGAKYVIQKRHQALLEAAGIDFEIENGGGRNLLIVRKSLIKALDTIANLPDASIQDREKQEYQQEQKIRADSSIPDKDREALVRSRVGQGVFRQRVLAIEPYCRLTGVSDPSFLRASHIKPSRVRQLNA